MSDNFTPSFLSDHYPAEVKRERAAIVKSFCAQILRGIAGPIRNTPHPAADKFQNSVQSNLFRFFQVQPQLPKKYKVATGDTFQLLMSYFEDAVSWGHDDLYAQPHTGVGEVDEQLRKTGRFVDFDYGQEYEASNAGALAAARNNLALTNTRIAMMSMLVQMTSPSEYARVSIDGVDEIVDELYRKRSQYALVSLMFSGLVGGAVQTEALRMVARMYLHDPDSAIKMSIIEYLQPEGRSPGQYLSKTEADFRSDIIAAYSRLGETGA